MNEQINVMPIVSALADAEIYDDQGGIIRDYGFNGFTGEKCGALRLDSHQDFTRFLLELAETPGAGPALAKKLGTGYRTDSLGMNMVVFFPGIDFVGGKTDYDDPDWEEPDPIHDRVNDEKRSLDDRGLVAFIDRVKAEIVADVEEGRLNSHREPMPITVSSYSELHDYVDANCYGGACEDGSTLTLGDLIAMQNVVDRWLREGGLKVEVVARVLYRAFSTNRVAEWEDIGEWDTDDALGRHGYRMAARDAIKAVTTSDKD